MYKIPFAGFILLTIITLISAATVKAQFNRLAIPFADLQNQAISNPLAGGLANGQFSAVDIDGDGREDLAIFDRVGNVWLTYRNNGTQGFGAYEYAPQWAKQLPKVEQWALLRDYNGDGVADLFANGRNPSLGQIGIAVYKGVQSANNLIRFEQVQNVLWYADAQGANVSHIFVSNVDIPDIADMDGDGDMDILTFNGLGGRVEWFKNVAVDSNLAADTLRYVLADNCWGRFYESGLSEALDLSPRVDSCARYAGWQPLRRNSPPIEFPNDWADDAGLMQPRHAGSALTTIDINADGVRELFLSDVSFDNVALVGNSGTTTAAWARAEETFFPAGNVAIALSQFPAVYLLDINNDGAKDLVVTPSLDEVSENIRCVWLYENIGTNAAPDWDYVQNDFLVENMIDIGKTAAPTWVDYDGDGLLDIIVGTGGRFVNTTASIKQLWAYKNVGTASQPAYRLVDTNFADLSRYNLDRISPAFVDIDADGDQDLIGGGEDGRLFYVQNVGTGNNPNFAAPVLNYFNLDVGSNSAVAWGDLDNDGDFDAVVGERNGNLNYFENIGSATVANFAATPTSLSFGNIDARQLGSNEGNSAPILLKQNNEWQLWTGAEFGGFYWHDSINNNLNGSFRDKSNLFAGLDEGRQSIGAIADINTDGLLDILVGNKRGGLAIFSYNPNVISTEKTNNLPNVTAYPNPATDKLWINTPDSWDLYDNIQVEIYNSQGQRLQTIANYYPKQNPINIQAMPTGLIWVKINTSDEQAVLKVIKINR